MGGRNSGLCSPTSVCISTRHSRMTFPWPVSPSWATQWTCPAHRTTSARTTSSNYSSRTMSISFGQRVNSHLTDGWRYWVPPPGLQQTQHWLLMEFTETKLECYSGQGRVVVKRKGKDKETQTLPFIIEQGFGSENKQKRKISDNILICDWIWHNYTKTRPRHQLWISNSACIHWLRDKTMSEHRFWCEKGWEWIHFFISFTVTFMINSPLKQTWQLYSKAEMCLRVFYQMIWLFWIRMNNELTTNYLADQSNNHHKTCTLSIKQK